MTGAGVLFLPQLWYIAYTIYPSQMSYFQRTSWFWSTLCIDKCIKPIFFAEISRSGHSFSCCNRLREPFRATKLRKVAKIDPWLILKKECQGRMSQLRLRFLSVIDYYLSPNVKLRRILLTVFGWTFKNEAMSCKSRNSMIPGQRWSNIS